jgi:hypothetical protein
MQANLCATSTTAAVFFVNFGAKIHAGVLPPYRFTGHLRISRKKFDYKFSQKNIRYMP